MPLSDRQIEAGSRTAVVISGHNAGEEGVTVTPAGADVGLDVNIVGGAGAGGTSMVDDAAFTPATTAITPAGGTYRSVRDLVDDNDAGALAMTQRRALLAELEVAGVSAMDAVNSALRVNMVAGGGAGGTSMADDAVFTPATTQVTPIAGFADEAAPDSVNEGDAGAVRMSLNRNLYTVIRDAAGNERGVNVAADNTIGINDAGAAISVDDAGGSLSVDDAGGALSVDDNGGSLTVDNAVLSVVGGGAEATAQRVTIANDSTGLVSVDDGGGTLTVDGTVTANLGAVDNAVLDQIELNTDPLLVVGGGAEATAQRVTIANDSTGVLSVDDNGGSLTVDVGAMPTAANAAEVQGTAAEDAAATQNPVMIGGRHHASVVVGDEVDDGDAVRILADSVGGVVRGHRADAWSADANYGAAQTDAVVKAAPGANLYLYVTDIIVSTEGVQTFFLESAAATIVPLVYLAANGGWSGHFQTPIRWPVNTAITITSTAAVNHSILVLGYTAPI